MTNAIKSSNIIVSKQKGDDTMTELYIATILLALTFLLICWVVTEFQIYNDSHSTEEELYKTRFSSRIAGWWCSVWETMHSARYFKQETLKEENKSTFLFGTEENEKKEKSRMAGNIR